MEICVEIDGREAKFNVEPRALLGQMLRDDAGIDQVKLDCETSTCGSCSVLLDGVAVKSCAVLGVMADGSSVTTATGLSETGPEAAVAEALRGPHVLPCGECRQAFTVVAAAVVRDDPRPSRETFAHALSGTVCRCTGYGPIIDALVDACARVNA